MAIQAIPKRDSPGLLGKLFGLITTVGGLVNTGTNLASGNIPGAIASGAGAAGGIKNLADSFQMPKGQFGQYGGARESDAMQRKLDSQSIAAPEEVKPQQDPQANHDAIKEAISSAHLLSPEDRQQALPPLFRAYAQSASDIYQLNPLLQNGGQD